MSFRNFLHSLKKVEFTLLGNRKTSQCSIDLQKEVFDRKASPLEILWFVHRIRDSNEMFKDVYSVMTNWGANHGAVSFGHIGADIITLCSMLRIPVCMHNVPQGDIFRPAAWNSFGMDKESADYRACSTFGPLY